MRKNPASQSGLFNPRVLVAFALCSVGALLTVLSFAATPPSWQLLQSGTPHPRDGATTVYDPMLGVNVMFGGYTGGLANVDSAETWTFDGAAWSRLLTAHSPVARHQASMAYDAAHQVVLLFGGVGNDTNDVRNNRNLNDTWSFNGVDWTQLMPANSPSPRSGASMVFDAARNQILLYGGSPDMNALTSDNDTWTWDGTNWTQQQPPVSPQTATAETGRYNASMAYDPDAQRVVLFGGRQCSCNPGLNDTWEWDGLTWSPFLSVSPPPGRHGAIMDYDAASKSLVLFGGTPSFNAWINDTWTWDPTNGWKQLSPPNSPSPRGASTSNFGSMSGAYDPKTSRLYFSDGHVPVGTSQGTMTDETWSWDGSTWTQIKENVPPGRVNSSLAYDAAHDEYILFGGSTWSTQLTLLNDTWIWKAGSWTQAHPANSPSPRQAAGLAYDSGSGKLVLFGGGNYTTSCTNDTWTWDGTNWHIESPATPPPALAVFTMASDAANGNVVMFGGFACGSTATATTYTYTKGQWTQLNPTPSPSGRYYAMMAYDPMGSGSVLLFGGYNGTLGTPVRFTMHWFGFGPLLTDPALPTPQLVIGFAKVKTIA